MAHYWAIYWPSPGHLLIISGQSTDHPPTAPEPSPDHLLIISGQSTDHPLTAPEPSPDHLLIIYRPSPDHLLTISWPSPDHLLTVSWPSPDHLRTNKDTLKAVSWLLPENYGPSPDKSPNLLLAICWSSSGYAGTIPWPSPDNFMTTSRPSPYTSGTLDNLLAISWSSSGHHLSMPRPPLTISRQSPDFF